MDWWLSVSLFCLLFSYFFLAFKLFIADYNDFREEGLAPEYEDIKSMLITAALWPAFAVSLLYDDLCFKFKGIRDKRKR